MLRKGVLLGGVLGLLAAALTAGCASGEALSREQYVSKLNAMCEDFSEKEKEIGDPQTLADLVEKGPRILNAFENAIVEEVRKLTPPDEIADQATRLVDLAHQQRDVIAELIDAAKDNDFGRARDLASKNTALNKKADLIARELGAEACTENSRSRD